MLVRRGYKRERCSAATHVLHTTLSKVDRELAQSGRWLAGSNYSLADIAAAPVIDRIQRLGMADLWAKLSAVKEWVERA
jgi:glutathione S-transferase